MLFQEFFPRLRDRAWQRYGETITERQFKDWREDGLFPGPAPPIGRGRGRSPERHWPVRSYRRALRICRYKSSNARRQSQWWLGLWLSGETVDPLVIRKALKRELSIERRADRPFVESHRWRNTRFETLADAERGGLSGSTDTGWLMSAMNLTPDQFRRLSILQLQDSENGDDIALFHEIAPKLFDIDPETAAEIRATIDPDEIRRVWRSGHMSQGAKHPGEYLDDISAEDIANALAIIRLREKAAMWVYAMNWLVGSRRPERVIFYLMPILGSRASALTDRISLALRIFYEIYADRRDGIDPQWRVNGEGESIAQLKHAIGQLSRKNREIV